LHPIVWLLLYGLALSLIFLLMWWLVVTTEGVYLGERAVIWLYDLFAPRYDRIKGYEPAIETRFLARPLMERLSPNHAPLVLDVATGTGRLPRTLLKHPLFQGRIIATDLSRPMLHYGAGRLAEALHHGRVVLMHMPAEHLEFPSDIFDIVTCLEAIEFTANPHETIAELVRVVRPGGWLLLSNRKGNDARMMPGKTWTPQGAEAVYRDAFGLLDVAVQRWQLDYDLVWARKPGEGQPTRARPLEEIWCCRACDARQMVAVEGAFVCGHCGRKSPIGKDGVILR
jgi:ubiquinone/menaquinone biosynthesis C-methylase UbiE